MMKCTNGACRVGSGVSLSSVSVSPAVSTLGGAACSEDKFDLAFLTYLFVVFFLFISHHALFALGTKSLMQREL